MKTFTEPEVLTDKSRLQEIFDLRVYAWEKSPSPVNINRKTYPNGLFDKFDQSAIHKVSYNEKNEIIAAERVNIIHNLEDLPHPEQFANIDLPDKRPFLYSSRLVIHPEYRKMGLKELYDIARLQFQVENDFAFSLAKTFLFRTKELTKFGWEDCGEAPPIKDYPFPYGENILIILLKNAQTALDNFEEISKRR
ncbi:MAG: hypothetical protein K1X72_23530 [Pyrinomonadaceae bacterium]|nr:hypothetical protein [Pyrinomonadaceae bacterium]